MMKYSVLSLVFVAAVFGLSHEGLAKQKPAPRHVCPTITHYFSWFSTYSDVCLEDMVDAETLRRIKRGGRSDAPVNVQQTNG